MAALCAIVMALTLVLVAVLKRRSAAENQLALLASTDGLTGLNNRRRFDEAIASEWRFTRPSGWDATVASRHRLLLPARQASSVIAAGGAGTNAQRLSRATGVTLLSPDTLKWCSRQP
jgi:hypothetical protein